MVRRGQVVYKDICKAVTTYQLLKSASLKSHAPLEEENLIQHEFDITI